MNRKRRCARQSSLIFQMLLAIGRVSSAPAMAQQISGEPGSPGATVTLDGKQLPPPPMPFSGVIKESAADSKPWWPLRVVPPKGAPNVLLIMTDDQGYGVSSTVGGVIPTPALERIAEAGLRYTQFHSTALRSRLWAGICCALLCGSTIPKILLTFPEFSLMPPLAEWDIQGSYDSAQECESGKVEFQAQRRPWTIPDLADWIGMELGKRGAKGRHRGASSARKGLGPASSGHRTAPALC